MPRVTNAPATKARHKRILKRTKGFFGNKSRLYRYAKNAVARAEVYAYRDRRARKGEFRALWIARINAGVRPEGLSYSRFMEGLKAANIELDRKAISEMAISDTAAFGALIQLAKKALADKAKK